MADQVQNSKEKKSAVRIALMTTLTPTENSPLDTERVHSALKGAYVAQYRANRDDTMIGDSPLIQLHLANEGSRQEQWGEAVRGLERMKDDDIPLLMVVGPGLSSGRAREAAEQLSSSGIPMVSAIITADDLDSTAAPGLLRASPRNSDYALSLRGYLEDQDRLSSGLILLDTSPGDEYASTLSSAYETVLSDFLGHDPLEFKGRTWGQEDQSNFDNTVSQICDQRKHGLDMVFFAGREADLKAFTRQFAADRCWGGEPLSVFYAATGINEDEEFQDNLVEGNLDLVMASSTHPGWARGPVKPPRYFEDFLNVFEGEFDEDPQYLDDGYAIMHHDAFLTAVYAVRTAHTEARGSGLTPERVGN